MVVGFGKDGRVSGVTSYHHLNTMEKKKSECPSYQRFCWSPPPTPLDRMPVHHMVTHQQSSKIPWHFAGTHLYSKGGGGGETNPGRNQLPTYLLILPVSPTCKKIWMVHGIWHMKVAHPFSSIAQQIKCLIKCGKWRLQTTPADIFIILKLTENGVHERFF